MENMTTTSTQEKLKAAYEALKAMLAKQEIVLATFPVMGAYSLIPKEAVQAYLAGKPENEAVLAKFSGEIFSTEKIKALEKVRSSVYEYMTYQGILMGKSGVYSVPAVEHENITKYLTEKAAEYERMVDDMLVNYDDIVATHKAKLESEVSNEAARAALLDKIPTKEKIQKQHACSFQFFRGFLPSEEEMEARADEIIRTYEQAVAKNAEFIKRVSILFSQFLNVDTNAKDLGKKYSAFCNATEKALSYETSTKLMLQGSQYEKLATAQFELLHQAKVRLCSDLSQKIREANVKKLLEKYKQISYVLSSEKELEAFLQGQIEVFPADFSLSARKTVPVSETFPCFAEVSQPLEQESEDGNFPDIEANTLDTLSLDEFVSDNQENYSVDETEIEATATADEAAVPTPEVVKTESVAPQPTEEELQAQRAKSIDEVLAELLQINNAVSAKKNEPAVTQTAADNKSVQLENTQFFF